MSRRTHAAFTAVRVEGGLLPEDYLQRIAAGDKRVPGLTPEAYRLLPHERTGELANRAWTRLVGAWEAFKDARARLPEGDPATRITRERWLLPLFEELGYGRLTARPAFEVEGRTYAISHAHGPAPIHLLGAGVSLDRRTAGVAGAATSAPHGLVQAFLNRSDDHLWGLLTNGLVLRVLRDHHSLTRQAYVEIDLEAVFEGRLYDEFLLLWLLCHESRVAPGDDGRPESCFLERWFAASREEGVRVLDQLRGGVQGAIEALGAGFLARKENAALHEALSTGRLTGQGYYRQLLRLVYRLIFLFVSEDRDVLLDPDAEPAARERYRRWYATAALRRLAERRRGDAHVDRWHALRLVMDGLAEGLPPLALPALGSFLWRREAIPELADCALGNEHLLTAVRSLSVTHRDGLRRQVSWKSMGSEELGSVYEALLELTPQIHRETAEFRLGSAPGHERKTTGSYYTPTSLVDALLDSALDPVLDEATAGRPGGEAEAALLNLKVCDPASGSGHFLVAAGRRIARRLAAARTGDEEPSPEALRHALRDVVGRCLYGVDLNEMAVELCKVSLWMEALEPGRPLSFLEGHIQAGNALLGATPAGLAAGIPDAAFKELTGDDKDVARRLRKRNKAERAGQGDLFAAYAKRSPADEAEAQVKSAAAALEQVPDADLGAVRDKERAWSRLKTSPAYRDALLRADAWCAAFVWPKTPGEQEDAAPTQELWTRLSHDAATTPATTRSTVRKLARGYGFFHWHLAFPQVFGGDGDGGGAEGVEPEGTTGWTGGFDVVLGNPPWERIKLQEKEYFAGHPQIAGAKNAAARKKRIAALAEEDPALWAAWQAAVRQAEGESLFVREAGRFPLCGRGDVNTYALFSEHNRCLTAPAGRAGFIVPAGIATDDTTKFYFQDVVDGRALASLYHFENEDKVFPAVDHRVRFVLLTLVGRARPADLGEFVGYARQVAVLNDPARRYALSPQDIALMNPNTRTLPVFRWAKDAEIARRVYRKVPVLVREGEPDGNPWQVSFRAMLHMANDSGLFRERPWLEGQGAELVGNVFEVAGKRWLPLFEAKMVHHFDHRFGTYEGQTEAQANQGKCPEPTDEQHAEPEFVALPEYWVEEKEVDSKIPPEHAAQWLLGVRKICRSVDARTLIVSAFPRAGFGDSGTLILSSRAPAYLAALYASLSSFVADYALRVKLGGSNLNHFMLRQIPVPPPSAYEAPCPWSPGETLLDWIRPRVLELVYTSHDMAPFARDLGYEGPPFRWDPDRRFELRCELDAAFFHLYGLTAEDVEHVMDGFWVVRQKDEKAWGEYRTKRRIQQFLIGLANTFQPALPCSPDQWQAG